MIAQLRSVAGYVYDRKRKDLRYGRLLSFLDF